MSLKEYWAKVKSGEIERNMDYWKSDEYRKKVSKAMSDYWERVHAGLAVFKKRSDWVERRFGPPKPKPPKQPKGQNIKIWLEKVRSGEVIDPRKGRPPTEKARQAQREGWKRRSEREALNKVWNELLNPII